MSKQAEVEYAKTCKEVAVQNQKIEKANDLIQREQSAHKHLQNEKYRVEKEVLKFSNDSNEVENVINGHTENLRVAKEGNLL